MFIITPRLPLYPALITCCIGFFLLSFGLVDAVFALRQSSKEIIAFHKRRARAANRGVVWVWVVCLAGLCVYAISFYVLVYPTLELIGIVEGLTTFDSNAQFTLNLCRTVLNWHPIIFIIGLLLWAFVNSQRREDITYPAY